MYAVIETGGKQYRVEKGSYLKVEKLELGEGDSIEFDKVLMQRFYHKVDTKKLKLLNLDVVNTI